MADLSPVYQRMRERLDEFDYPSRRMLHQAEAAILYGGDLVDYARYLGDRAQQGRHPHPWVLDRITLLERVVASGAALASIEGREEPDNGGTTRRHSGSTASQRRSKSSTRSGSRGGRSQKRRNGDKQRTKEDEEADALSRAVQLLHQTRALLGD